MKKKILLLFLLLIAGFIRAAGDDKNLVTVTVEGFGNDTASALTDALNNAIMQVASEIVDSRTLMVNDEIVKEKVLTASSAIVKKCRVIEPAKRDGDGFTIRIEAQVEQNILKQKLVEQKLVEGTVEGSMDFWAEQQTTQKNQADMKAMIDNFLDKIDLKKYLQFDVMGMGGTTGSAAKLYIAKRQFSDTEFVISAGLVCTFDSERFYDECIKNFEKILDELPFETRHAITRNGRAAVVPYTLGRGYAGIKEIVAGNGRVFEYDSIPECSEHRMNSCILLNTSWKGGRQRFTCYSCKKDICGWRKEKTKQFGKLRAAILLLDGNGREIRRMEHKFIETIHGSCGAGIIETNFKTLVITPEIAVPGRGSLIVFSNVVVVPLSTTVPLEELKEIRKFKLEVTIE